MPEPLEIAALVEAQAAAWSSVEPPNATGQRLAAAFAETIAALAALRGGLAFEQEPASFLAALHETRERTP
jgi:hypothetical protein